MTSSDGPKWPPFEEVFPEGGGGTSYTDEFGEIDADVYRAACELWNSKGGVFAQGTLGDIAAGSRLMKKAAADVTRSRRENDAEIKNLLGYMWMSYKRLVLKELEKENEHRRRDLMSVVESSGQGGTEEDLDRKILLQEVVRRMNAFTREIFELLVVGHDFSEIGEEKKKNPRALKRKFDRQIVRLMKEIEAAHKAAANKCRQRNRLWPFRLLSLLAIAVPLLVGPRPKFGGEYFSRARNVSASSPPPISERVGGATPKSRPGGHRACTPRRHDLPTLKGR